jgi:hypothetical protein
LGRVETAPLVLEGQVQPATRAGPGQRRLELLVLAALVAYALVARVVIALTLPPWQSPDEPKHFEYVRLVADRHAILWAERRLLNFSDESGQLQGRIIASLARYHYWDYVGRKTPSPLPARFVDIWPFGAHTQIHRPSLQYYLVAPALLPFLERDLETQLRLVRLTSALLSALAVAATYLAARELAPRDPFVPIASGAFVAALPMHVFIGGAVNNDNLATLFGAGWALGVAAGFRRGFTLGRWLLVLGVLILILTLATKRVGVGLIPGTLFAGTIWIGSLRGRSLRIALGGLTAFALASAALGSLVRHGLPLDAILAGVTAYALNCPGQLDAALGVSLTSEQTQTLATSHLAWLFRSFWGVFGWFNLPLSPRLYLALGLASALLGLAFIAWLAVQLAVQVRAPTGARATQLRALAVYLAAIVSMVWGGPPCQDTQRRASKL